MYNFKENQSGYSILNNDTGEVIASVNGSDGLVISSGKEQEKRKDYFKKQEDNEKKEALKKQELDELGSFIWSTYHLKQIVDPKEMRLSNITRLMYLATYLDYNGYLMEDTPFSQKSPLSNTRIRAIMNLSKAAFSNFYNQVLCNEKIFKIKCGKYKINEELFSKGALNSFDIARMTKDDKYIMRVYINGVREMYIKATPSSHKTLSYLFQIIPYVNRQYNIVCYNPLETNLKKIKPMTLGGFCRILGYDETHSSRLFSVLFEPMFTTEYGTQSAVRYVATKSTAKKTYNIFINPRVYYAGDNWKEVEILGAFN